LTGPINTVLIHYPEMALDGTNGLRLGAQPVAGLSPAQLEAGSGVGLG